MVPKKAKEFKKPTSDELNLSEELVSDVIDFYWMSIRKQISELAHPYIEIPNFGIFKIKSSKIDEKIVKLEEIISNMDGKYSAYIIKKDLSERVVKLTKLKKEILEEREKFKIIKKIRNAKNTMEEQNSNLGRSDEQDLQEGPNREDLQEKNEDL